jgi:hypothetical protein
MITALEAPYLSLTKEQKDYLIQLDMDIKAFANAGQTFIKIPYPMKTGSHILTSNKVRCYLKSLGYKIEDIFKEDSENPDNYKIIGCIIKWRLD